jgi:hypothetical protein
MNDDGDGPGGVVVYTDAAVPHDPDQLYAHQTYPFHVPQDEVNDTIVKIRGSKIAKCRELALRIGTSSIDWFSVAAAFASLGIGGLLGGWASALSPNGNVLYYVISACLTVSGLTLGVAVHAFKRKTDAERAAEILELLPANTQPQKREP